MFFELIFEWNFQKTYKKFSEFCFYGVYGFAENKKAFKGRTKSFTFKRFLSQNNKIAVFVKMRTLFFCGINLP